MVCRLDSTQHAALAKDNSDHFRRNRCREVRLDDNDKRGGLDHVGFATSQYLVNIEDTFATTTSRHTRTVSVLPEDLLPKRQLAYFDGTVEAYSSDYSTLLRGSSKLIAAKCRPWSRSLLSPSAG